MAAWSIFNALASTLQMVHEAALSIEARKSVKRLLMGMPLALRVIILPCVIELVAKCITLFKAAISMCFMVGGGREYLSRILQDRDSFFIVLHQIGCCTLSR